LMGATELLARLGADAQERARGIRAEQEQAVREINSSAEADAARILAEGRRRADQEVERVLERARGRARLAVRNAVLTARWQVLRRVVSAAERRVLGDPGYAGLVAGLVARYATDGAVVHLSASDAQRFGASLRIKAVEPAPISGGVIIQSGRTALSFVLRDTIEEQCEARSAELGRMLFGA
jgi:vacuolar-type H+-ATPase subunit E/Vma4